METDGERGIILFSLPPIIHKNDVVYVLWKTTGPIERSLNLWMWHPKIQKNAKNVRF